MRPSQADLELREYIKTVESHLNILIEIFERHLPTRTGNGPRDRYTRHEGNGHGSPAPVHNGDEIQLLRHGDVLRVDPCELH